MFYGEEQYQLSDLWLRMKSTSLICECTAVSLLLLNFSSLYVWIGAELQGWVQILMFQRFLLTGRGVKTPGRVHLILLNSTFELKRSTSPNLRLYIDTNSVFLVSIPYVLKKTAKTVKASSAIVSESTAVRGVKSFCLIRMQAGALGSTYSTLKCLRQQTSNAPLIVFPSEIIFNWQTLGPQNWKLVSRDKNSLHPFFREGGNIIFPHNTTHTHTLTCRAHYTHTSLQWCHNVSHWEIAVMVHLNCGDLHKGTLVILTAIRPRLWLFLWFTVSVNFQLLSIP